MRDGRTRDGGRLVVVATPIGNLGDLSPRAAEALRDADLVLAEDTRRTATLLRHVDASTPMKAHHQHNEAESTAAVIPRLLAGAVVVIVSDAGTPLVSDPGQRLVEAVVEAGILVEAVPGPSAALHALVVAGLPAERFTFEGFIPRKGVARAARLAELAGEQRTSVWFVSPHRAAAELRSMAEACAPDRRAALCRELTKLHEEVWRGTLTELAERADLAAPRGELTLVVAGAPPPPPDDVGPTELAAEVAERVVEGERAKDAAGAVAARHGLRKNDVYDTYLTHR
jgi:16S rRNA (cytidine1402-2'-O)-methyltransferase